MVEKERVEVGMRSYGGGGKCEGWYEKLWWRRKVLVRWV